MQHWNLLEIETPGGTRSPEILYSGDEARVVLIRLQPGQKLGDHQVKEHVFVVVVDGAVHVTGDGRTLDAGPGSLFLFEPDEQHAVATDGGARLLLLLAPWPGPGPYRGGDGDG